MDELLKLLASLGLTDEQNEKIKEVAAAEFQIEKDKTYNKDQENLKLKNVFKKLGKEKGANYDEFVDGLLEKINSTETTVQEKESSLNELNSKLADITAQLNTIKEEKATALKKANELKARTALTEKLSGKVYGEKFLIDSLLTQNEFVVDGDEVKFGSEDNRVGVEDFVKATLEANKDILKQEQKSGSGSDSGETTSNKSGVSDRIANARSKMETLKHLD